MWSADPSGFLRPFQRGADCSYFITKDKTLFAFFTVLTFALIHKSNGGQDCFCLRKNKGGDTKRTSSHYYLQSCTSLFLKKLVSLKNVIEAVKIILLNLNL